MVDKLKSRLSQVIMFIVATALGSGTCWHIQDQKYNKAMLELEIVKTISDLRARASLLQYKILQLTAQYITTREAVFRGCGRDSVAAIVRQKTRLDALKDDYQAIEKLLAKLEHREPRPIPIDYGPPGQTGAPSWNYVR